MNQLQAPVAAARSAGDKLFLETFIAFVEGIYFPANPQQAGFFQNLRGQLAQSATKVNNGLVQQHQYRTTVDAVTDRLLAEGTFLEHKWRPIIDAAGVPANLPAPPALTAERGLRVANLSGG
jgi:hypothetical protein